MEYEKKKERLIGWIFLSLWAVLIIAGIVAKRVYGHPDLMVFFHLPAAVFLVLSGYKLSYEVRKKYKAALLEASIAKQKHFSSIPKELL